MEAASDEDAASARRVTLDLSFKNQHHVLTLPASTPLHDIRALAEAKTGIAPVHQKLIHKGKTLMDPTITLGQLGGETGTVKLVLIGTTAAALAALAEGPKQVGNVRIINDLGSTGGSGRGMVPILRSRRYGFQRVDVLPHLPEQERARRILTELASDPGVLHVMEKYQWSVGALCEMYPEGLVGVSSVCVMGLNENKGQRILLRLRTDDLQGWRKVLSVRKVLYHEMAHNIHSDHDDQFHILMRTIEREVNAFNNSGRAIGGSTYIQADSTAWGPAAFAGGSGRLGGASADLTQVLPARVMAGHAALQRLSEEEQAIEDACASGRHVTPTLPALPPPPPAPSHDGCCSSSCSSSSSSSLRDQQEGEVLPSSLPHHHHHSEPLPVEAAMSPTTEEQLLTLETSSLAVSSAPSAAQAPPTLLSTNPWAEATPTPVVAAENEKEVTVALLLPQPPQPSSTSLTEAPAAPAEEEQKQVPLPLAPPPDELTTTITQPTTVADTAAAIVMDDATEQLLGLGFAERKVRGALQECGGDVMQAADYLLLMAAAEEGRAAGGGGGMDSDSSNADAAAAAAAAAAAVVDLAFAPPPDSRQARVMEAAQRLALQTRGEPEAGTLAFSTLQSMLQSLLDHPQEPKYKRVRLGNAKFQRAVGRFPPAMDLLRAVGFEERERGQVLEYTRNDAGLLWWGKSAVEGAQEQVGKK